MMSNEPKSTNQSSGATQHIDSSKTESEDSAIIIEKVVPATTKNPQKKREVKATLKVSDIFNKAYHRVSDRNIDLFFAPKSTDLIKKVKKLPNEEAFKSQIVSEVDRLHG